MGERRNGLGQPIGFAMPDWTPRPLPPRTPMTGRTCRVEPVDPARHAADLHDAYGEDREGRIWTYLGYGPFESLAAWTAWMEKTCLGNDPLYLGRLGQIGGNRQRFRRQAAGDFLQPLGRAPDQHELRPFGGKRPRHRAPDT